MKQKTTLAQKRLQKVLREVGGRNTNTVIPLARLRPAVSYSDILTTGLGYPNITVVSKGTYDRTLYIDHKQALSFGFVHYGKNTYRRWTFTLDWDVLGIPHRSFREIVIGVNHKDVWRNQFRTVHYCGLSNGIEPTEPGVGFSLILALVSPNRTQYSIHLRDDWDNYISYASALGPQMPQQVFGVGTGYLTALLADECEISLRDIPLQRGYPKELPPDIISKKGV